jgi:hypothetical protein
MGLNLFRRCLLNVCEVEASNYVVATVVTSHVLSLLA